MWSPEKLLIASIVIPLIGAFGMALMSRMAAPQVRIVALVFSLVTLATVTGVIVGYLNNVTDGGEFASVQCALLPVSSGLDIQWSLSVDGLTLWLYGLSALLVVTCVLVSWEAIHDRPALFYAMLLLLEAGCLGVFTARDIMLFYIFFEFTLIPLFFIIGIWGSEDRRHAAIKFFLFTLAGSLLTFLGLLVIVFWGSPSEAGAPLRFSISALTSSLQARPMPPTMQLWVFALLFAGFAVKVPLFPLHTWLPLAHVQAPTAGSILLAGVLLKIGTYGFLRLSIPMMPDATAVFMPWILSLAVAGIIYGALVALAQSDMKRLIAFSSVSHLGYCMLGLFALNRIGTQGAVLQMVNHGLSTGALFTIIGMIYERLHTREVRELGGLARLMPGMAFFMLLFTFSSIGLPGLNGFVGEVMVLLGMFQRGWAAEPTSWTILYRTLSVLSLSGVVLGAAYMLSLVARTFFGRVHVPAVHHDGSESNHSRPNDSDGETVRDLKPREILALAPLAVFVVWIGICPQFFLRPIQGPVEQLTHDAQQVVARSDSTGLPENLARTEAAAASPLQVKAR